MHLHLWKKLIQLLVLITMILISSQLTIFQAKSWLTSTLVTLSRLHHNISPLPSAINTHIQMKQIEMSILLLPLISQQILIFWNYWQNRYARKWERVNKMLRLVLTVMFPFCEARNFFSNDHNFNRFFFFSKPKLLLLIAFQ